jgi:biotin transport system substrate-specific component
VASQALYLLLGLVGLPVFAGASHGSGVVFGASGGYLIGFLVAAAIVGAGARRGADRSPVRTLVLYALASAVIYALGTTWLCIDTGMSASAGIAAGVTPFIPGDVGKALLAAGLLPGAWLLLGRGPARRETPAEDAP